MFRNASWSSAFVKTPVYVDLDGNFRLARYLLDKEEVAQEISVHRGWTKDGHHVRSWNRNTFCSQITQLIFSIVLGALLPGCLEDSSLLL